MTLDVPKRVGAFELGERIGQGGMGVVYRARHLGLQRPCAVKLLLPGPHLDEAALQRFVSEARLTASLDAHPNVVAIYDAGREGAFFFIAMELVEGTTLKQRIEEGLPPREGAQVVARIADALSHVHAKGVIQRRVEIRPFLLGRTELTEGQWRAIQVKWPRSVPKTRRGRPKNRPTHPITGLSWRAARVWNKAAGFRMPSEAQWEYACRAGSTTRFFWGDEPDLKWAWLQKTKRSHAFPTNLHEDRPNAFGLVDMPGNVWEWCGDAWHPSYKNAPRDHVPWQDPRVLEKQYVMRGGCYSSNPIGGRSAFRHYLTLNGAGPNVGMRVVADLTLGK